MGAENEGGAGGDAGAGSSSPPGGQGGTALTGGTQPPAAGAASATSPAPVELKLPDGVSYDVGPLKKLAEGLKLDGKAAQGLLDFVLQSRSDVEASHLKSAKELHEKWVEDAKADKEIGGAKQAETQKVAIKALREFGNRALVDLLDQSGLGDHPEVIRCFFKVGQKLAEDTVSGSVGSNGSTSSTGWSAAKWYPNSPALHKE